MSTPVAPGYGRSSQDWSYLTAKRALGIQSGVVTNPSLIDDSMIIDTTLDSRGNLTSRGRNQTLVIFVVPKSGATLAADATLHLWAKVDWATEPQPDASSSSLGNQDVGNPEDLDDADRWALMEAAKHTSAVTGSFASGLAFSFPWLPAGIYKAAIAVGLTGEAIIVEQHTE